MATSQGLFVMFGTAFVGLIIVFTVVVLSERFANKWALLVILPVFGALGYFMDVSSARFGFMQIGSWELATAGGSMFWALMLLVQDYMNEFYGKSVAKFAVWGMFLGKLSTAAATLWLLYAIPNPPDPDLLAMGEMWNQVLYLAPRIAIGSILAAFLASLFNVWLYDLIKTKTGGRHLWLRNNVSSLLSQIIDALVFTTIAFAFVLPVNVMLGIALVGLVIKWITNIVDTIFLYLMYYVKRNGIFGVTRLDEKDKLVISEDEELRSA